MQRVYPDDLRSTPLQQPGSASVDAASRRQIGRRLQAAYSDVVEKPLPARFEQLLAVLRDRLTGD